MPSKFPTLFDDDPKTRKERIIRFFIWMSLMFISVELVSRHHPKNTALVPCLFMMLIWPMILMPLRRKNA